MSLRKRYDEETVKGWLVPHTGIKGIPGVVGTGVAWCVISSLVYIISPYLSLEQESYKSLTPTGGKDYFVFVFAFVQFAFLCSLYQRRNSDWLPRLLLLSAYMGYDVRNVRKGDAERSICQRNSFFDSELVEFVRRENVFCVVDWPKDKKQLAYGAT